MHVIARVEEGAWSRLSVEHRVLFLDGESHHVVIDMVALRSARVDKSPRRGGGTICDVTATHRAAEALRRQRGALPTLVDNL